MWRRAPSSRCAPWDRSNTMNSRKRWRSGTFSVLAVAAVCAAACTNQQSPPAAGAGPSPQQQAAPQQPAGPQIQTTAAPGTPVPGGPADWKAVEQAFGKAGQVQPGEVYRIGMPRADLKVTVE